MMNPFLGNAPFYPAYGLLAVTIAFLVVTKVMGKRARPDESAENQCMRRHKDASFLGLVYFSIGFSLMLVFHTHLTAYVAEQHDKIFKEATKIAELYEACRDGKTTPR